MKQIVQESLMLGQKVDPTSHGSKQEHAHQPQKMKAKDLSLLPPLITGSSDRRSLIDPQ